MSGGGVSSAGLARKGRYLQLCTSPPAAGLRQPWSSVRRLVQKEDKMAVTRGDVAWSREEPIRLGRAAAARASSDPRLHRLHQRRRLHYASSYDRGNDGASHRWADARVLLLLRCCIPPCGLAPRHCFPRNAALEVDEYWRVKQCFLSCLSG
ncbi:hypothetical protein MRX96_035204 [Rhipicephalus microplus]